MANRGQNEGIRIVDDFVCQAIHEPSVPRADPASRARSEGVHVIDEFVVHAGSEGDDKAQESTGARTPASSTDSVTAAPRRPPVFIPTTALAQAVTFDDRMMHVALTDGRVLSVPLVWFPTLQRATSEQRQKYEIGGGGIGLRWPELNEDLSIAGLMAGVDSRSA
jgi:hypothetical protein